MSVMSMLNLANYLRSQNVPFSVHDLISGQFPVTNVEILVQF